MRLKVCTIVARNYLAHARVLAESVRQHHPDAHVSVLIIDAAAVVEPTFETLAIADIGIDDDEFQRMAMIYDVTELASAVKPWLLATLLRREESPWLYLDPDMLVLAPLADLAARAEHPAMVLTPHLLDPIERDGARPTEADILSSGTYNLGFLGVGPRSAAFLTWWQERLRRDCISDIQNFLFVDQRWVDVAAHMFGSDVVTDRGVNVAYWNAAERPIRRTEEGWTAGGVPLRLFHFSGYVPTNPSVLTRHHPELGRVRLGAEPDVAALTTEYAQRLVDAGYDVARRVPYGFDRTWSGHEITPLLRRRYRTELLDAESRGASLPVGFDREHADAFARWAGDTAPVRQLAVRAIGYAYAAPGEDGDSGIDAGLTLQEHTMRHWCEARGWTLVDILSDVPVADGESRPNAGVAIDRVRRDHGVLIIVRSEALPGGLAQVASLAREAVAGAFDLVAVDIGVDTTEPSGRAMAEFLCDIDESEPPPVSAPLPPVEMRYLVLGAGNDDWFERTGYRTLQEFEDGLAQVGRSIEEFSDILDWGCGCGRVLRHVAERVPEASLTGVDVDARAAAWLSHALPQADIRAIEGLPPLPFADESFDLLFGYSIFTHLDRSYQDAWLRELHRVMKPGAALLVTVNGPVSFEWHAAGPLQTRREIGRLRRRLLAKGFVFWDKDGWERWFPDFYHTTWHTPEYVKKHWGKWFKVRAILEGKAGAKQDLVVLER